MNMPVRIVFAFFKRLFCTFHNMIAFAGLMLQLVWPLFLGQYLR